MQLRRGSTQCRGAESVIWVATDIGARPVVLWKSWTALYPLHSVQDIVEWGKTPTCVMSTNLGTSSAGRPHSPWKKQHGAPEIYEIPLCLYLILSSLLPPHRLFPHYLLLGYNYPSILFNLKTTRSTKTPWYCADPDGHDIRWARTPCAFLQWWSAHTC